ncbi:IclR family transcriptional regulator [Microbacterium xanthum]|uniref:IclR family transcriptional regulator n=1 Tax=Microbacterium xanthum TaxID=3079794 RepID=UPI002AD4A3EA|nr:IclR family transcriptional regulator [Microbacterium sp. KSW-48]MDZ8171184.1 IclR family transcriptional regulator [Microbacterium sp. KSW-48]
MSPQSEAREPRRNASGLARDIEVLELLGSDAAARTNGMGVSLVARRLGRDKAVVSRTLATLADAGLVARNEETLHYTLGPRLYVLASRTASSNLVSSSHGVLRKLVQATRETSHLCVLHGGNVLTLVSELSPYDVRTAGWAGSTTSAWRTPSGRVLLSDWDDASLARWYADHGDEQPLIGPFGQTDTTDFPVRDGAEPARTVVSDLESLREAVASIREKGYALSDEELERGVVAASAPVRDYTGRVVAALNVSGPKSRIGSRLAALGPFVARHAEELSTKLGAAIRQHPPGSPHHLPSEK